MNTDHIKTFLAVYRAGSFIKVAKDRNVAPSSVTRSISALEATLKTRLFQRSTRSLTPTEAGEMYYQRMFPIMEEFAHAHETFIQGSEQLSGRLRITASVSYGQIVIAPKLKAFRDQYPEVELDLLLSDARIDLIVEQIDVAIRHGQLSDTSLIARKLKDVSYYLVASPDYLRNHMPIKRPADIVQHELLAFPYENYRHEWRFEEHGTVQTLPINPVLTISNASVIRQCVLEGHGIALLADWTVSKDLERGNLVRVLPQWIVSGTGHSSATWIVYPSSRFIPAKTKAFARFLCGEP